jgi:2,4-dienoyl-CoA reductase-like NADH-dependent reductase (Old Yellow Enzyme family)
MSKLFTPIEIRGETIPNRLMVSPMCQYSAEGMDGKCCQWHLVHYGTRAVGGAGLVMVEATSVQPEGRITPWDLGLWSDGQMDQLKEVVDIIVSRGSTAAIQLAHAGRKASHKQPWAGGDYLTPDQGGWEIVGPSPLPYEDTWGTPNELSVEDIDGVVADFASAAQRSVDVGMRVIELHMAHGYLGCEFLSPLSNKRRDQYGGTLENRARFAMQTVKAVRKQIPDSMPLFVRVSATEYMEGGWDIDECVEVAKWMGDEGVDLIDCSSGGNSSDQTLKPFPGYQVQFASRIKKESDILTGAVGLITSPGHAEQILVDGEADIILMARELLRNPYWPLIARDELDNDTSEWPSQYARVSDVRPYSSS